MSKHKDVELFIEHWEVEPVPGVMLEVLDKTDYDVYDCVVTRVDEEGIWVQREDRDKEELVDVLYLQTPAADYELEDIWMDYYGEVA